MRKTTGGQRLCESGVIRVVKVRGIFVAAPVVEPMLSVFRDFISNRAYPASPMGFELKSAIHLKEPG